METDGGVVRAHGENLTVSGGQQDAALFTVLAHQHGREMLRVAYFVLGDPSLAQDAVQSAWARAWAGRAGLRDLERARSWLLKITGNEARRLASRRRTMGATETRDIERTDTAGGHVIADMVDLGAALKRFSAEDRELLGLRHIASLTAPEISNITGRSPGAIRVRLSRLHAEIRKELNDD